VDFTDRIAIGHGRAVYRGVTNGGQALVITHGECHHAVTTADLVRPSDFMEPPRRPVARGGPPAEGLEQATESASEAGAPTR
jgi:hypothetical protein